eukprot:Em0118g15a
MAKGLRIGVRVKAKAMKILGARGATQEFGKQTSKVEMRGEIVRKEGAGPATKWVNASNPISAYHWTRHRLITEPWIAWSHRLVLKPCLPWLLMGRGLEQVDVQPDMTLENLDLAVRAKFRLSPHSFLYIPSVMRGRLRHDTTELKMYTPLNSATAALKAMGLEQYSQDMHIVSSVETYR